MFETDWTAVLTLAAAVLAAWFAARASDSPRRALWALVVLVAVWLRPESGLAALAAIWSLRARAMTDSGLSLVALAVELAIVGVAAAYRVVNPWALTAAAAAAVLALRGLWFSWEHDRGADGRPHGAGLWLLAASAACATWFSDRTGIVSAALAHGAATLLVHRVRSPAAWALALGAVAWCVRSAAGTVHDGSPDWVAVSLAGDAVALPWVSALAVPPDAAALRAGFWTVAVVGAALLWTSRRGSPVPTLLLGAAAAAPAAPVASATLVLLIAVVVAGVLSWARRERRLPRVGRAALCAVPVLCWATGWVPALADPGTRAARLERLGVRGAPDYARALGAKTAAERERLLERAWREARPGTVLRGAVGRDRGDDLAASGRQTEALAVWEEVAREAPLDALLLRGLAERFEAAGAPVRAREQWMRLGAADRGAEAEWTRGVARSYLSSGSWGEVADWAERSLDVRDAPQTRLLLATAAERRGALAAAVEHLENAVDRDPDHLAARRRLAALYRRTGRDTDAGRQWDEVVRRAQGDPEARLGLADLCVGAGRRDTAREHVERAEVTAETDPAVAARIAARRSELQAPDGSRRGSR